MAHLPPGLPPAYPRQIGKALCSFKQLVCGLFGLAPHALPTSTGAGSTFCVFIPYFSLFNGFHRSIHPCTDTKGQLVVSRRTAPSSRRLVHLDLSTQTRYELDSAAELVEDPVRAAADARIARPRPTATPMRCRQCFPDSYRTVRECHGRSACACAPAPASSLERGREGGAIHAAGCPRRHARSGPRRGRALPGAKTGGGATCYM